MAIAHPKIVVPQTNFEKGIFAGPIFPAYGHFLLESLARLWVAEDCPDWPIVFSTDERSPDAVLTVWMQALLGILGLKNPVIVVSRPVIFKKLMVPEPGYEIQYRFATHHAKFLGRIPWSPVAGKKLWVSRAHINKAASADNGLDTLETALAADGWQIIHPESLPIADQLGHFASAERIAGEQGSALHSLIFLQSARGLRLDAFARDPTLSGHQINHNQATICHRRHVDYRLHRVAQETVAKQHAGRMSKTYAPPETYLELLKLC